MILQFLKDVFLHAKIMNYSLEILFLVYKCCFLSNIQKITLVFASEFV